MKPNNFSDMLREEANPIWETILDHPFLIEMRNGTLPLDNFGFYAKQDYVYLIEFARCLGLAAAKGEDIETMKTLASLLEASLTVEIEVLEKLCEKINVPLDQLRKTKPAPTNTAYTKHLLSVAYSGSVGEIMAALLPCMWSYQEIGDKMKEMATHPIYNEWCATYRSKEYAELVDWFKLFTDECASQSGDNIKKKMRDHFMLSSRYEYMFWDMAYKKETWPV